MTRLEALKIVLEQKLDEFAEIVNENIPSNGNFSVDFKRIAIHAALCQLESCVDGLREEDLIYN